ARAYGGEPVIAEVQRVEQVRGGGVGASAAPCAGVADDKPGGRVRVGPVQVRGCPRAVIERAGTAGADFLARQFDARAQIVPHAASVETGGQVGLVGEDAVGLILEGGIA